LKEPTYRTRAQLIRTAVDHHLGQSSSEGDETETSGQQPVGVPESVEERLDDIFQHMYRTQSVLENLDERLTRIEQDQDVEGPAYDLKKVVFEVLPDESQVQTPDDALTADAVAGRIGADTEEVEGVLQQLADTTKMVERVEMDIDAPGDEFDDIPPAYYAREKGRCPQVSRTWSVGPTSETA